MLALAVANPSNADLIDRGNGLIYDDDLNITWLQNANYPGGTMTWLEATAWADALVFEDFDDWRLSKSDTNCSGNNCTGSEMGHLFYEEGITSSSSGLFQDVRPSYYWSETENENNLSQAWRFNFLYGTQGTSDKTQKRYAWAVRDGDVTAAPVAPEPISSVLFVIGGATLGIRRCLRKR